MTQKNEKMAKIDHLSYSKIRMFRRCPQQFWFRYVDPAKPMPPDANLTLGKSVHKGLGANFQQKIESLKDLPKQDVLDIYSTEFDYHKPETIWNDNRPGEVKDTGYKLLGFHYDNFTPRIIPAIAEFRFLVPLTHTISFSGYMDVVDTDRLIIDFKITSRSPNKDFIRTNQQLTCYTWAFRELFGEQESGVAFQYLIHRKSSKRAKKPRQEVFTATEKRSQEDIDEFLNETKKIALIIEAGLEAGGLPKTDPTNWWCSSKFCGWYNTLCRPHKKQISKGG